MKREQIIEKIDCPECKGKGYLYCGPVIDIGDVEYSVCHVCNGKGEIGTQQDEPSVSAEEIEKLIDHYKFTNANLWAKYESTKDNMYFQAYSNYKGFIERLERLLPNPPKTEK